MRACTALISLLLVGLAALGGGCDDAREGCVRHTDCADGERCADGLCTPALFEDAGSDVLRADGAMADLEPRADGADGAPLSDLIEHDGARCSANADDRIDLAELPIVVGAEIAYTIGSGLTLDLRGTSVGGRRTWTLQQNAVDDARQVLALQPLFSWAQDSFPDATYTSLIDRGYGTYGVFQLVDRALKLQGVISKDEPGLVSGTKLIYSEPLDMLRFPIAAGDAFETNASASGTFDGLYLYVSERYEVEVLGAGALVLPEITFDNALLVQVSITQTPYANPFLTTQRAIFMFVVECYGIVARVVVDHAPDDLSAVEAKERWRLSF